MVDKSRGKVPDGQTSRGFPSTESRNPKNQVERRPDVGGYVADQGDAGQTGPNRKTNTSDQFPETMPRNNFAKGTPATIPDPDRTINRGYTEVNTSNVPTVTTNVGANRQMYGIDPGDVTQPDGDSREGVRIPKFGSGDQS